MDCGKTDDATSVDGAVWRGHFECAEQILRLYAEQSAGREKITRQFQAEGWAYRDRNGNPAPLEIEDIRRVTNNWPEYGGVVIGEKAAHSNPLDYDPNAITLNPERAVFDVTILKMVGRVQLERTHRAPDRGHAQTDFPYPLVGLMYCAHCEGLAEQQTNPKLRSRLGGKTKSRYRHKAGHPCRCAKKTVTRAVYEADFLHLLHLMKLRTVKPEMIGRLQDLTLSANSMSGHETQDMETKKAASIAKCRRKIEAARHLCEHGDISR